MFEELFARRATVALNLPTLVELSFRDAGRHEAGSAYQVVKSIVFENAFQIALLEEFIAEQYFGDTYMDECFNLHTFNSLAHPSDLPRYNWVRLPPVFGIIPHEDQSDNELTFDRSDPRAIWYDIHDETLRRDWGKELYDFFAPHPRPTPTSEMTPLQRSFVGALCKRAARDWNHGIAAGNQERSDRERWARFNHRIHQGMDFAQAQRLWMEEDNV